jgi:hypothetical protein
MLVLLLDALAALLLSVCTASAGPAATAQGAQSDPIVARGRGLTVRASEIEGVLLSRYAMSADGRELLRLLLSSQLIDRAGRARGIRIPPARISERCETVDRQLRLAGDAAGLAGHLEQRGLSREEFREYIRLALIHEELTRQDLGLPEGAQVSGEQQEVWLEQEMQRQGLETARPPWEQGFVARCGEIEVDVAAFGEALRESLAPELVRESAWHVLLAKGLEARLPDLPAEELSRALDAEVERRRRRQAEENPTLSFEQVLGAQGRTLEGLRADPSVRVAALSRLHVDRSFGPQGLRRVYDEERELFEGRHGEAVRTHLIFLVASRYKNQLNPRTFEEAERILADFLRQTGNTSDFAALAEKYSEEPGSRAQSGQLGWVTRSDPRYPPAFCEAVFADLEERPELPAEGRGIGPIRLDAGCAILWVSGHRDSPPWSRMAEHVHEELRRRLLLDVMPGDAVELL